MRLLSNSLWNLVGGFVPAVAAIVTVPVVVGRLGEVHYGLLTLITSIVGYFALLDVNATQGSVKYFAEFHSRGDGRRMGQLFNLGIGLYLLIGTLGGLGIGFFADPLTTHVFNVPPALHEMAVRALQFGGVAFFFSQVQMYLLSIPQSLHRFDLSARNEAIFGSAASVSTVLIVLAGGGLVEIMAARAALSAANAWALWRVVCQLLPDLRPALPGRDVVKGLMSFSFYAYLSRFATVTYASADKLLIGAYVDMRALALYAVPFLLANRVFSLTYRLGQVMLPEASRLDALGQHEQLRRKYLTSARWLLYLNCAVSCLLVLFGRELLHHWAGPSFAEEATLILMLVVTAVLLDSLTNLPSLVNDGMGKPANTGIFAFVRACVGLAAAWLAVRSHGIVGVAWAQLLVSALMSLAFLAWVHAKVLPATLGEFARTVVLPCVLPWGLSVALATAMLGHRPGSIAWSVTMALLAALVLAAYGWWVVLTTEHRAAFGLQARVRLQTLRARWV